MGKERVSEKAVYKNTCPELLAHWAKGPGVAVGWSVAPAGQQEAGRSSLGATALVHWP